MTNESKKIIVSSTEPLNLCHTVTHDTQISLERSSIQGLDYILRHFEHQSHIWPRTISTKSTQARQIIVNNKENALVYFKSANYLDCRISAYPYWRASVDTSLAYIKNAIVPNLIMIDLDLHNIDYDEDKLARSLKETLGKIKELLQGFKPTVLVSGNGYHVYIPINNKIVLEDVIEFADTDQVSTKFLRFAEWYLSSGKSDPAHNSTVSMNNCMLRIPGTYNSKNGAQVRIINRWNTATKIPDINLLIGSFMAYFTGQRLKEEESKRQRQRQSKYSKNWTLLNYNYPNNNKNRIYWIEILLRTPVYDHRKYSIWRILAPYLLNIKKLSYEQAFNIIKDWLRWSSEQRRLDFNSTTRIKEGLKGAKNGYFPIRFEKLKIENNDLYNLLVRQKVSKGL